MNEKEFRYLSFTKITSVEEIKRLHHDEFLSINAISQIYNVHSDVVKRYLKEHGIEEKYFTPARTKLLTLIKDKNITIDKLTELNHGQYLNYQEIADYFGIKSKSTVKSIFLEFGLCYKTNNDKIDEKISLLEKKPDLIEYLKYNSPEKIAKENSLPAERVRELSKKLSVSYIKKVNSKNIDASSVLSMYNEQFMDTYQIATKLDIAQSTVQNILCKNGYVPSTISEKIFKSKKNEIITDYENNKLSLTSLFEKYKIPAESLSKFLKKEGVKIAPNNTVTLPVYELADFLKKLVDEEIILNDRSIVPPYEIDIYIPTLKIGIEFNGLYWHTTDKGKHKNYHMNKTDACTKIGVRLIQIFSDEWDSNKDLVKRKLTHILGKANNRIYARKCSIKTNIDINEARKFLEEHHIQGFGPGSISYGLYLGDEIVSFMNFIRRKDSTYELNRYASKNVVGGFSKLLKQFINENDPKRIKTFADKRWSAKYNNVYEKNGFVLSHESTPNYFYTKNFTERYTRQQFMKHKLANLLPSYDEKLTELENMKNNGYSIIYDCGNFVYYWDKK